MNRFLKATTWLTVALFLATDLLAFPAQTAEQAHALSQAPLHPKVIQTLSVPEKLGMLDEAHIPQNAPVRGQVIFIQDAHDSLEAQLNISNLIQHFVERHSVKTVYEEGYSGKVPTDQYFGKLSPEIREKVSYFYLDKLRLGGAEYAHINRKKNFDLVGVDSEIAYAKNISAYKDSSKHQPIIREDLLELNSKLQQVAKQVFREKAYDWYRLKSLLRENRIDQAEYLKRLVSRHALPQEFDYLKALFNKVPGEGSVDIQKVLTDLEKIESYLEKTLLKSTDEKKAFQYLEFLQLLLKLNAKELTQKEFENVTGEIIRFDTREMAEFIARQTRQNLLVSKHWEDLIHEALKFYRFAQIRDETVKQKLKEHVESNRDPAILVFGGFHADAIKTFLKKENIAYAVVSPKITELSAKHQNYYKELMAVGHLDFEKPLLATAARPESRLYQTQVGALSFDFASEIEKLATVARISQPDLETFVLDAERFLHVPTDTNRPKKRNSPQESSRRERRSEEDAVMEKEETVEEASDAVKAFEKPKGVLSETAIKVFVVFAFIADLGTTFILRPLLFHLNGEYSSSLNWLPDFFFPLAVSGYVYENYRKDYSWRTLNEGGLINKTMNFITMMPLLVFFKRAGLSLSERAKRIPIYQPIYIAAILALHEIGSLFFYGDPPFDTWIFRIGRTFDPHDLWAAGIAGIAGVFIYRRASWKEIGSMVVRDFKATLSGKSRQEKRKQGEVYLDGKPEDLTGGMTWLRSNEDTRNLVKELKKMNRAGGGFLGVGSYINLDLALLLGADAIVLADKDKRVVDFNRALLKLISETEDFQDVLSAFQNFMIEQKVFSGPEKFRRYFRGKDGAYLPHLWIQDEKHFLRLRTLIRERKVAVSFSNMKEPETLQPAKEFFDAVGAPIQSINLSNLEEPVSYYSRLIVTDRFREPTKKIIETLDLLGATNETFVLSNYSGGGFKSFEKFFGDKVKTVKPGWQWLNGGYTYAFRTFKDLEQGMLFIDPKIEIQATLEKINLDGMLLGNGLGVQNLYVEEIRVVRGEEEKTVYTTRHSSVLNSLSLGAVDVGDEIIVVGSPYMIQATSKTKALKEKLVYDAMFAQVSGIAEGRKEKRIEIHALSKKKLKQSRFEFYGGVGAFALGLFLLYGGYQVYEGEWLRGFSWFETILQLFVISASSFILLVGAPFVVASGLKGVQRIKKVRARQAAREAQQKRQEAQGLLEAKRFPGRNVQNFFGPGSEWGVDDTEIEQVFSNPMDLADLKLITGGRLSVASELELLYLFKRIEKNIRESGESIDQTQNLAEASRIEKQLKAYREQTPNRMALNDELPALDLRSNIQVFVTRYLYRLADSRYGKETQEQTQKLLQFTESETEVLETFTGVTSIQKQISKTKVGQEALSVVESLLSTVHSIFGRGVSRHERLFLLSLDYLGEAFKRQLAADNHEKAELAAELILEQISGFIRLESAGLLDEADLFFENKILQWRVDFASLSSPQLERLLHKTSFLESGDAERLFQALSESRVRNEHDLTDVIEDALPAEKADEISDLFYHVLPRKDFLRSGLLLAGLLGVGFYFYSLWVYVPTDQLFTEALSYPWNILASAMLIKAVGAVLGVLAVTRMMTVAGRNAWIGRTTELMGRRIALSWIYYALVQLVFIYGWALEGLEQAFVWTWAGFALIAGPVFQSLINQLLGPAVFEPAEYFLPKKIVNREKVDYKEMRWKEVSKDFLDFSKTSFLFWAVIDVIALSFSDHAKRFYTITIGDYFWEIITILIVLFGSVKTTFYFLLGRDLPSPEESLEPEQVRSGWNHLLRWTLFLPIRLIEGFYIMVNHFFTYLDTKGLLGVFFLTSIHLQYIGFFAYFGYLAGGLFPGIAVSLSAYLAGVTVYKKLSQRKQATSEVQKADFRSEKRIASGEAAKTLYIQPVPMEEHPFYIQYQRNHIGIYPRGNLIKPDTLNRLQVMDEYVMPFIIKKRLAEKKLKFVFLGMATGEQLVSHLSHLKTEFDAHPQWGAIEEWQIEFVGVEAQPITFNEAQDRLNGITPFAYRGPPEEKNESAIQLAENMTEHYFEDLGWSKKSVRILNISAAHKHVLEDEIVDADIVFADMETPEPRDLKLIAEGIRDHAPNAYLFSSSFLFFEHHAKPALDHLFLDHTMFTAQNPIGSTGPRLAIPAWAKTQKVDPTLMKRTEKRTEGGNWRDNIRSEQRVSEIEAIENQLNELHSKFEEVYRENAGLENISPLTVVYLTNLKIDMEFLVFKLRQALASAEKFSREEFKLWEEWDSKVKKAGANLTDFSTEEFEKLYRKAKIELSIEMINPRLKQLNKTIETNKALKPALIWFEENKAGMIQKAKEEGPESPLMAALRSLLELSTLSEGIRTGELRPRIQDLEAVIRAQGTDAEKLQALGARLQAAEQAAFQYQKMVREVLGRVSEIQEILEGAQRKELRSSDEEVPVDELSQLEVGRFVWRMKKVYKVEAIQPTRGVIVLLQVKSGHVKPIEVRVESSIGPDARTPIYLLENDDPRIKKAAEDYVAPEERPEVTLELEERLAQIEKEWPEIRESAREIISTGFKPHLITEWLRLKKTQWERVLEEETAPVTSPKFMTEMSLAHSRYQKFYEFMRKKEKASSFDQLPELEAYLVRKIMTTLEDEEKQVETFLKPAYDQQVAESFKWDEVVLKQVKEVLTKTGRVSVVALRGLLEDDIRDKANTKTISEWVEFYGGDKKGRDELIKQATTPDMLRRIESSLVRIFENDDRIKVSVRSELRAMSSSDEAKHELEFYDEWYRGALPAIWELIQENPRSFKLMFGRPLKEHDTDTRGLEIDLSKAPQEGDEFGIGDLSSMIGIEMMEKSFGPMWSDPFRSPWTVEREGRVIYIKDRLARQELSDSNLFQSNPRWADRTSTLLEWSEQISPSAYQQTRYDLFISREFPIQLEGLPEEKLFNEVVSLTQRDLILKWFSRYRNFEAKLEEEQREDADRIKADQTGVVENMILANRAFNSIFDMQRLISLNPIRSLGTRARSLATAFQMMDVKKGDRFVEFGPGDGTLSIAAALMGAEVQMYEHPKSQTISDLVIAMTYFREQIHTAGGSIQLLVKDITDEKELQSIVNEKPIDHWVAIDVLRALPFESQNIEVRPVHGIVNPEVVRSIIQTVAPHVRKSIYLSHPDSAPYITEEGKSRKHYDFPGLDQAAVHMKSLSRAGVPGAFINRGVVLSAREDLLDSLPVDRAERREQGSEMAQALEELETLYDSFNKVYGDLAMQVELPMEDMIKLLDFKVDMNYLLLTVRRLMNTEEEFELWGKWSSVVEDVEKKIEAVTPESFDGDEALSKKEGERLHYNRLVNLKIFERIKKRLAKADAWVLKNKGLILQKIIEENLSEKISLYFGWIAMREELERMIWTDFTKIVEEMESVIRLVESGKEPDEAFVDVIKKTEEPFFAILKKSDEYFNRVRSFQEFMGTETVRAEFRKVVNIDFLKVREGDEDRGYIYQLPAFPENFKDKENAKKYFEEMALDFPKILEKVKDEKLPLVMVIPQYILHEHTPEAEREDTMGERAPWIEGARTALAWASAYARFHELGDMDVRVAVIPDESLEDPEKINSVAMQLLEQEFFYDEGLTPEENFEAKMFFGAGSESSKSEVTQKFTVEKTSIRVEEDPAEPVVIDPNFPETEPGQERIFVSGGAGFLGTYWINQLLDEGHQIILMDNFGSGTRRNLKFLQNHPNAANLHFVEHDVSRPFEVKGDLDKVIHLASLASPPFYYTDPIATLRSGLQGTKRVLELSLSKNAVFFDSSTSEVYGDPEQSPQSETYVGNVNPWAKRSQYDQSKRGGETLIKLFFEEHDLDVRMVRIFNTYGRFMRLDDGRVITNFIKSVLYDEDITIYGEGEQTRSFGYVADTVGGMDDWLKRQIHGPPFESLDMKDIKNRVVNVGNPYEFTIGTLASKMNEVGLRFLGRETEIIKLPNPDATDPKQRQPNIERAKDYWGYEPQVLLDEGSERIFSYFLEISYQELQEIFTAIGLIHITIPESIKGLDAPYPDPAKFYKQAISYLKENDRFEIYKRTLEQLAQNENVIAAELLKNLNKARSEKRASVASPDRRTLESWQKQIKAIVIDENVGKAFLSWSFVRLQMHLLKIVQNFPNAKVYVVGEFFDLLNAEGLFGRNVHRLKSLDSSALNFSGYEVLLFSKVALKQSQDFNAVQLIKSESREKFELRVVSSDSGSETFDFELDANGDFNLYARSAAQAFLEMGLLTPQQAIESDVLERNDVSSTVLGAREAIIETIRREHETFSEKSEVVVVNSLFQDKRFKRRGGRNYEAEMFEKFKEAIDILMKKRNSAFLIFNNPQFAGSYYEPAQRVVGQLIEFVKQQPYSNRLISEVVNRPLAAGDRVRLMALLTLTEDVLLVSTAHSPVHIADTFNIPLILEEPDNQLVHKTRSNSVSLRAFVENHKAEDIATQLIERAQANFVLPDGEVLQLSMIEQEKEMMSGKIFINEGSPTIRGPRVRISLRLNNEPAGYFDLKLSHIGDEVLMDYGFFKEDSTLIDAFTAAFSLDKSVSQKYRGIFPSIMGVIANVAKQKGYKKLTVEHALKELKPFIAQLTPHRDKDSFWWDLNQDSLPPFQITLRRSEQRMSSEADVDAWVEKEMKAFREEMEAYQAPFAEELEGKLKEATRLWIALLERFTDGLESRLEPLETADWTHYERNGTKLRIQGEHDSDRFFSTFYWDVPDPEGDSERYDRVQFQTHIENGIFTWLSPFIQIDKVKGGVTSHGKGFFDREIKVTIAGLREHDYLLEDLERELGRLAERKIKLGMKLDDPDLSKDKADGWVITSLQGIDEDIQKNKLKLKEMIYFREYREFFSAEDLGYDSPLQIIDILIESIKEFERILDGLNRPGLDFSKALPDSLKGNLLEFRPEKRASAFTAGEKESMCASLEQLKSDLENGVEDNILFELFSKNDSEFIFMASGGAAAATTEAAAEKDAMLPADVFKDKHVAVVGGRGNMPFVLKKMGAQSVTVIEENPILLAWQKAKLYYGQNAALKSLYELFGRSRHEAGEIVSMLSQLYDFVLNDAEAEPVQGYENILFESREIRELYFDDDDGFDLVIAADLFGVTEGLNQEADFEEYLNAILRIRHAEGSVFISPVDYETDLARYKGDDFYEWLKAQDLEGRGLTLRDDFQRHVLKDLPHLPNTLLATYVLIQPNIRSERRLEYSALDQDGMDARLNEWLDFFERELEQSALSRQEKWDEVFSEMESIIQDDDAARENREEKEGFLRHKSVSENLTEDEQKIINVFTATAVMILASKEVQLETLRRFDHLIQQYNIKYFSNDWNWSLTSLLQLTMNDFASGAEARAQYRLFGQGLRLPGEYKYKMAAFTLKLLGMHIKSSGAEEFEFDLFPKRSLELAAKTLRTQSFDPEVPEDMHEELLVNLKVGLAHFLSGVHKTNIMYGSLSSDENYAKNLKAYFTQNREILIKLLEEFKEESENPGVGFLFFDIAWLHRFFFQRIPMRTRPPAPWDQILLNPLNLDYWPWALRFTQKEDFEIGRAKLLADDAPQKIQTEFFIQDLIEMVESVVPEEEKRRAIQSKTGMVDFSGRISGQLHFNEELHSLLSEADRENIKTILSEGSDSERPERFTYVPLSQPIVFKGTTYLGFLVRGLLNPENTEIQVQGRELTFEDGVPQNGDLPADIFPGVLEADAANHYRNAYLFPGNQSLPAYGWVAYEDRKAVDTFEDTETSHVLGASISLTSETEPPTNMLQNLTFLRKEVLKHVEHQLGGEAERVLNQNLELYLRRIKSFHRKGVLGWPLTSDLVIENKDLKWLRLDRSKSPKSKDEYLGYVIYDLILMAQELMRTYFFLSEDQYGLKPETYKAYREAFAPFRDRLFEDFIKVYFPNAVQDLDPALSPYLREEGFVNFAKDLNSLFMEGKKMTEIDHPLIKLLTEEFQEDWHTNKSYRLSHSFFNLTPSKELFEPDLIQVKEDIKDRIVSPLTNEQKRQLQDRDIVHRVSDEEYVARNVKGAIQVDYVVYDTTVNYVAYGMDFKDLGYPGHNFLQYVVKRAQELEEGEVLTLVDWGAGDGTALLNIREALRQAGIADERVRLAGFSHMYFESLDQNLEKGGFEFILDGAENFQKYFDEEEIDIIYSHQGLNHLSEKERYFSFVLEPLLVRGGVVAPGITLFEGERKKYEERFDVFDDGKDRAYSIVLRKKGGWIYVRKRENYEKSTTLLIDRILADRELRFDWDDSKTETARKVLQKMVLDYEEYFDAIRDSDRMRFFMGDEYDYSAMSFLLGFVEPLLEFYPKNPLWIQEYQKIVKEHYSAFSEISSYEGNFFPLVVAYLLGRAAETKTEFEDWLTGLRETFSERKVYRDHDLAKFVADETIDHPGKFNTALKDLDTLDQDRSELRSEDSRPYQTEIDLYEAVAVTDDKQLQPGTYILRNGNLAVVMGPDANPDLSQTADFLYRKLDEDQVRGGKFTSSIGDGKMFQTYLVDPDKNAAAKKAVGAEKKNEGAAAGQEEDRYERNARLAVEQWADIRRAAGLILKTDFLPHAGPKWFGEQKDLVEQVLSREEAPHEENDFLNKAYGLLSSYTTYEEEKARGALSYNNLPELAIELILLMPSFRGAKKGNQRIYLSRNYAQGAQAEAEWSEESIAELQEFFTAEGHVNRKRLIQMIRDEAAKDKKLKKIENWIKSYGDAKALERKVVSHGVLQEVERILSKVFENENIKIEVAKFAKDRQEKREERRLWEKEAAAMEVFSEKLKPIFGEALNGDQEEILARMNIERKESDGSPVTKWDKQIERVFREFIFKEFPNDSVFGEEYGRTSKSQDRIWLIDPIDGTKSFEQLGDLFGTVITLYEKGEPVFSYLYLPYFEYEGTRGTEVFVYNDQPGILINGKRLRKARTAAIEQSPKIYVGGSKRIPNSTLGTDLMKLIDAKPDIEVMPNISSVGEMLKTVLFGDARAFINFRSSAHDFPQQAWMAQKLGLIVTDDNGQPVFPLDLLGLGHDNQIPKNIIVGTKKTHSEAINLFAEASRRREMRIININNKSYTFNLRYKKENEAAYRALFLEEVEWVSLRSFRLIYALVGGFLGGVLIGLFGGLWGALLGAAIGIFAALKISKTVFPPASTQLFYKLIKLSESAYQSDLLEAQELLQGFLSAPAERKDEALRLAARDMLEFVTNRLKSGNVKDVRKESLENTSFIPQDYIQHYGFRGSFAGSKHIELFERIFEDINSSRGSWVAVDGVSGVGKTSFVFALKEFLEGVQERPVVILSKDFALKSRVEREEIFRGVVRNGEYEDEAVEFWDEALFSGLLSDIDRFFRSKKKGAYVYSGGTYDRESGQVFLNKKTGHVPAIPKDAIVLVEGSYAIAAAPEGFYDTSVFLDVLDKGLLSRRAVAREIEKDPARRLAFDYVEERVSRFDMPSLNFRLKENGWFSQVDYVVFNDEFARPYIYENDKASGEVAKFAKDRQEKRIADWWEESEPTEEEKLRMEWAAEEIAKFQTEMEAYHKEHADATMKKVRWASTYWNRFVQAFTARKDPRVQDFENSEVKTYRGLQTHLSVETSKEKDEEERYRLYWDEESYDEGTNDFVTRRVGVSVSVKDGWVTSFYPFVEKTDVLGHVLPKDSDIEGLFYSVTIPESSSREGMFWSLEYSLKEMARMRKVAGIDIRSDEAPARDPEAFGLSFQHHVDTVKKLKTQLRELVAVMQKGPEPLKVDEGFETGELRAESLIDGIEKAIGVALESEFLFMSDFPDAPADDTSDFLDLDRNEKRSASSEGIVQVRKALRGFDEEMVVYTGIQDLESLSAAQFEELEMMVMHRSELRFVVYGQGVIHSERFMALSELSDRVSFESGFLEAYRKHHRFTGIHFSKARRPSRTVGKVHYFHYLENETGLLPAALLWALKSQSFKNKVLDIRTLEPFLLETVRAYFNSLILARAA